MKTEIDGHLYRAGRVMIDVAHEAAAIAGDFMGDMLDTPDARRYCHEGLTAIEKQIASVRHYLKLYTTAEADREAALDGAAEGVRKAVMCPCGKHPPASPSSNLCGPCLMGKIWDDGRKAVGP